MNCFNKAKTFLRNNSSIILTCTASVGVIATAITAAKATLKAEKILKANQDLDTKEKIKLVAPVYIPSALIGISTIGCIFGVHGVNKRIQSSMTSAYAMLYSSYEEYKKTADDVIGEGTDYKIRGAIMQNHYNDSILPKTGDGECLFMEFNSLQLFSSTLNKVSEAEKAMNELIDIRGHAYLSEMLELLGLPYIEEDGEKGWSTTTLNGKPFEILITKPSESDDFYAVYTTIDPVPDYMF